MGKLEAVKNPNVECQMTKEILMTNDENPSRPLVSGFGLRHSFVIRHSSFVISSQSLLATIVLAACTFQLSAEPLPAIITISPQPLHTGHISPMLFGNFIELLDDLVPGMWAEMLNDRSFEGVIRLSNWVYYDGQPGLCDREWDKTDTWRLDPEIPFNGSRSARITATRDKPGVLTQSSLSAQKESSYIFSGYFRTDDPSLTATVSLKFKL